MLEETLEPEHLRDVLTSFVEGDREAGAETVDALADEFLGDLACYPSITGNTSLTEGRSSTCSRRWTAVRIRTPVHTGDRLSSESTATRSTVDSNATIRDTGRTSETALS